MGSKAICRFLVLLLFGAFPALALPPNLIKGGGFDTSDDLRNWGMAGGGFVDWQGIDAQARANSGSLVMQGHTAEFSQCVRVTQRIDYEFGAKVMVTHTTHRPSSPLAYMKVEFLASQICSGPVLESVQTRTAVTSANGRFVALSGHSFAPDGVAAARVTLIANDPDASGFNGPQFLFDDVFVRARGACSADPTTLCLDDAKLGMTVTYFDNQDVAHKMAAVQVSPNSGYFYTYGADDAELTIRMTEAANGSKSFVIGGMTDLRLQMDVTDWTTGDVRSYSNPSLHFLSPIVDAFPAN
jgi:hypothetical protein